MFFTVEDIVKQGEHSLGDMEFFFQDDFDDDTPYSATLEKDKGARKDGIVDGELPDVVAAKEKTLALVGGLPKSREAALPLEQLKGTQVWAWKMEELLQQSTLRRKKRGPTSVPVSAYVYSRTPRGVPLLVSALSQYEDRYIGAIFAGQHEIHSRSAAGSARMSSSLPNACASLPPALLAEENAAFERCRMQSTAAAAETKIFRMRASTNEWKRQEHDASVALQKATAAYNQALHEDLHECKRIRRELLSLGIATVGSNADLPLSPLGDGSTWANDKTSNINRGAIKGAMKPPPKRTGGRGGGLFVPGGPGRGNGPSKAPSDDGNDDDANDKKKGVAIKKGKTGK